MKLCLWCSKTVPSELTSNTCCSRACASKLGHSKRTKRLGKKCLSCGSEISRKKDFCNYKCLSVFRKKQTEEKILRGDKVSEGTLKKHLINTRGNRCELCGWDKINPKTGKCPIQLEHVDGHYKNNSLTNLQLLCPNCHSLTPTFGALNKGNGRSYRYAANS